MDDACPSLQLAAGAGRLRFGTEPSAGLFQGGDEFLLGFHSDFLVVVGGVGLQGAMGQHDALLDGGVAVALDVLV